MEKFTNKEKVYKNFIKFEYKKDGSQLKPSTRKGKKWMILDINNNKWVHFGALGYEDYTVHGDKNRRNNYHSRMGRFSDAYKYSPGYLSLVLLW
jgi:hypothetical protein